MKLWEGLVAGTAGIVSLIADNIYGDTAELPVLLILT